MPSIRITQFMGIAPEISARNTRKEVAQMAHNCLLWDGSLRPMPAWVEVQRLSLASNKNHVVENKSTGTLFSAHDFGPSVYLNSAPFAKQVLVGIDYTAFAASWYKSNLRAIESLDTIGQSRPLGIPTPSFVASGVLAATITSSSVGYISRLYSKKPVNRIIGVTFCRQTLSGFEESTLAVLPNQAPYGIMFEGDTVTLTMALNTALLTGLAVTHIRLYRTISGLDTGEQIANELDTEWHLIDTLRVAATINYSDGGAVTTDPMDLYLAGRFYPPSFDADYFGLLEGGWFYMANSTGRIALSERYLHNAWPTENGLTIPELVTGVAVHYDNLYVGTNTAPYIVAVGPGEGEQGLQASAVPFAERLPCLPGSMVTGPSGAIYASPSGLVGLNKSGAKVITAGITNAGDALYSALVSTSTTANGIVTVDEHTALVSINRTIRGAYWNGKYFGFVQSLVTTKVTSGEVTTTSKATKTTEAYIYNVGDEINGEKQFQQLVTMDAQQGTINSALVTRHGLTLKYANQLFKLPLPGEADDEYEKAKKLCYRWKSKRFVFPGQMTLAAGKISRDCGGSVTLKLFVDCKLVWQTEVCNSQPFRIPTQIRGVNFEIELIGTARVNEVHLASSMQELTEHE